MKIVIDRRTIWLNYHHLYCFYMISKEGSLAAASKALGIGASALSIQMRQFEEQLGFSLFERAHRKIRPNERGHLVLSYAKEIFRIGSEMVEAVHDRPMTRRIHLQIGALDTIPKHLSVKLVMAAMKIMPCSVSVLEGKPNDLVEELLGHRLDILVTNSIPSSEMGQTYAKRISRLPLWVVGGRSFLKLKKGFPQSLRDQTFVVPTTDSNVRQEFDSFLAANDIAVDRLVETQDVMVQKLLAIQQLGLTVMPEFAIEEYLEKKDLYLIGKLQTCFEELFLISASRKIDHPVVSQLIKGFRI